MNADSTVGWAMVLFAFGMAALLFASWLRYQDIKAWQKVDDRIRELDAGPFPDPEFVDRLRADVQAAAWEHERTPMYDRIAERRLHEALQDDDQLRRWLQ